LTDTEFWDVTWRKNASRRCAVAVVVAATLLRSTDAARRTTAK